MMNSNVYGLYASFTKPNHELEFHQGLRGDKTFRGLDVVEVTALFCWFERHDLDVPDCLLPLYKTNLEYRLGLKKLGVKPQHWEYNQNLPSTVLDIGYAEDQTGDIFD